MVPREVAAAACAAALVVGSLYLASAGAVSSSAPGAAVVPESDERLQLACDQLAEEAWEPPGGISAGLRNCLDTMASFDFSGGNLNDLIDQPDDADVAGVTRRPARGADNVLWNATVDDTSSTYYGWGHNHRHQTYQFNHAQWLVPPNYKQQPGEARIVFIHGGTSTTTAVLPARLSTWHPTSKYYYTGMTMRLANWTGLPVLQFDYPTVPVVAWPQNMRFVLDYIAYALENGPDGEGRAGSIILFADSEGALLAMQAALNIVNSTLLNYFGYGYELAKPHEWLRGVMLSSPVLDLACESPSMAFNYFRVTYQPHSNETEVDGDPDTGGVYGYGVKSRAESLGECRATYLAYFFGLHGVEMSSHTGVEANAEWQRRRSFFEQPTIAPLHGDYHNFPPLLVLSGTNDYYYSDGPMLAKRACLAGSKVEVLNAKGAFHDYIEYSEGCGGGAENAEAVEAYRRIAAFVREHTKSRNSSV